MLSTFIQGFILSAGLIIAIGSQNAFVLKQGLLKQSVSYVVFICFICDVLLMSVGLFGFGSAVAQFPLLTKLLTVGGFVFLFFYGLLSFIRAYKGGNSLELSSLNKKSTFSIIVTTFAVTLLNPHVYLDTVVVMGSIGANLNLQEKYYFLFGALIASFSWFGLLGYGSAFFQKFFMHNKTWQVLDLMIGVIMWFLAFNLLKVMV